jgi:hypothetical protein
MFRMFGMPQVIAVCKGSDCCLTRCSIRAAVTNDEKEASKNSAAVTEPLNASKGSESKDQASSKRPAQLALFTGVYIGLVGMALLVFPTSLFGETPSAFLHLAQSQSDRVMTISGRSYSMFHGESTER